MNNRLKQAIKMARRLGPSSFPTIKGSFNITVGDIKPLFSNDRYLNNLFSRLDLCVNTGQSMQLLFEIKEALFVLSIDDFKRAAEIIRKLYNIAVYNRRMIGDNQIYSLIVGLLYCLPNKSEVRGRTRTWIRRILYHNGCLNHFSVEQDLALVITILGLPKSYEKAVYHFVKSFDCNWEIWANVFQGKYRKEFRSIMRARVEIALDEHKFENCFLLIRFLDDKRLAWRTAMRALARPSTQRLAFDLFQAGLLGQNKRKMDAFPKIYVKALVEHGLIAHLWSLRGGHETWAKFNMRDVDLALRRACKNDFLYCDVAEMSGFFAGFCHKAKAETDYFMLRSSRSEIYRKWLLMHGSPEDVRWYNSFIGYEFDELVFKRGKKFDPRKLGFKDRDYILMAERLATARDRTGASEMLQNIPFDKRGRAFARFMMKFVKQGRMDLVETLSQG